MVSVLSVVTVWLLAARGKCVICCYGLVIGSEISVLSVVTVWLLAMQ